MADLRESLPLDDVSIDDEFWRRRREVNRTETIESQYEQLNESGTLENFRRATAGERGGHSGMWFQDSDAYKWIEAASFVLTSHDDPDLERRVDEVIDLIADAQADDGYLDTYFALEAPEKRWTNLNVMHELYCAGHLIEAAVAHYRATGERSLLDVAVDLADHVDEIFGDEIDGAPGHQGIELALMKLADVTDEQRYRDRAAYFVDVRGNSGRFDWEDDHRDEIATLTSDDEDEGKDDVDHAAVDDVDETEQADDEGNEDGNIDELAEDGEGDEADEDAEDEEDNPYDRSYNQAHAPLREQEAVEGHAVRAMYYFAGATDVAAATGDDDLLAHLDRLWENMTQRRMYVTGGIGSQHAGERFSEDYDLPNDTAYAETCAAIGSVYWNQRLFAATGDAKYHDLIERTLYNAVLVGVSLDGTAYFYDNVLASDGDHHRSGWFECACCPPNLARLLASLERYLYAVDDDGLYVNQYVGGTATTTVDDTAVTLTQTAEFPWDGAVSIAVETDSPTEFALRLRVPPWCDSASISVDGTPVDIEHDRSGVDENGYVSIERTWDDAEVTLDFEMDVQVLSAHPDVAADAGRVALERGPIVYALEGVDHDRPLHQYALDPTRDVEATFRDDLLEGVWTLEGEATVPTYDGWNDQLYRPTTETDDGTGPFTAVPYYAWDNREPGSMAVWLHED